jgi:hypothetical protein
MEKERALSHSCSSHVILLSHPACYAEHCQERKRSPTLNGVERFWSVERSPTNTHAFTASLKLCIFFDCIDGYHLKTRYADRLIREKERGNDVTERYHLPITLLLESIGGLHERLFFTAQLPPLQGSFKKGCVAELLVYEGKVLSCIIKDTDGSPLYRQEQAYRLLVSLGTLDWHPSSPPETSTQERSPDHGHLPFLEGSLETKKPIRKTLAVPAQFSSHRHRQVFNLADGTRTMYQIASLLHLSPEEVRMLLLDLQQQQIITISAI